MIRKAEISRKTMETDITAKLALDGKGNSNIDTGIGFLDHMLTLFTKHGQLNLDLIARGDIYVDAHHTVEDIGIVLGKCISEALGNKESIQRYGNSFVPMDESLAQVCLDISGRAFLVFDVPFTNEMTGTMETQLFEEFFRALAFNAGITLHVKLHYGKNSHHMIEAVFKAFGRALREAVKIDKSISGVMSTKGSL
jgi:imidazoleglycerol-phosphate dehydratase